MYQFTNGIVNTKLIDSKQNRFIQDFGNQPIKPFLRASS